MILIIDNYDSFVYNLVQYVGEVVSAAKEPNRTLGNQASQPVVIRRNDRIDVERIREMDPDGIIVSPGPGTPQNAGVSMSIFAEIDYPTLGVCLGHQALCATHGMSVGHAPKVVHGKPSEITHDGNGLFKGLPKTFEVGRYHSLAAEEFELPDNLIPTARTDDDREVLMGVRHADEPHVGVQFHPESILTDVGKQIIENFYEQIVTEEEGPSDRST